MRVSPLKEKFQSKETIFEERYGCEIVKRVKNIKKEYDAISKAIGISDFSYMQKFIFPEEKGLSHISHIVTGNIEKIDYGSILNTYILDKDGFLISDCYVIRGDGEYILLCESIANDEVIKEIIKVENVEGAKDLTDSYIIIGIDGCKVKEIISDLFGKEALELPPLTAEKICVEEAPLTFLRTSKFTNNGYLIMTPIEIKDMVFNTILESARKIKDFSLCGTEVQNILRLEENLFNIYAEGKRVKNPIFLGLEGKIDLTKESFNGKDKIISMMRKNIKPKKVMILSDEKIDIGGELFSGDEIIGIVVAECFSIRYNKFIVLAIVKERVASEKNILHYKAGNKIQAILISKVLN